MIVKLFQSEGLETPVIDVTHEWSDGENYYPMTIKQAQKYIAEKKQEGYKEISVGSEIPQNPEEAVVGMDLIREDSDNKGGKENDSSRNYCKV